MKTQTNQRGFSLIEFSDLYEQECSIQKSSLATDDAIWFGVDNTGPGMGNEKVQGRMHLNREQAAVIIPVLQFFVKNGELPKRYRQIKP